MNGKTEEEAESPRDQAERKTKDKKEIKAEVLDGGKGKNVSVLYVYGVNLRARQAHVAVGASRPAQVRRGLVARGAGLVLELGLEELLHGHGVPCGELGHRGVLAEFELRPSICCGV